MSGGLIQLIIKGIQDSPLISDPEITFFKKVYKQYTQFALCQNTRYLGNLEFNKESTKIIEKNGDLLYNQYFKIEIPYFENNQINYINNIINNGYNINSLKIIYSNLECIVIYNNNNWYIIPLNLLKSFIYSFNRDIVNNNDLYNNLLPDYISISNTNSVYFLNISYDKMTQITDIILLNSNYFEQIWTNNIINNKRFTELLTLPIYYNNLYKNLYKYIYYFYQQIYFVKKNNNYFNFHNEVERYITYINNNNIPPDNTIIFDIDITYKYCYRNNLLFINYINNVKYNSSVILLVLDILYSSNLIFSFCKKYNISNNYNKIQSNILISNDNVNIYFTNEWVTNLNNIFYNNTLINKNNIIFNDFENLYSSTSQQIIEIFSNTLLNDPTTLYINLKKIFNRFYAIPYYQINFNNFYYAGKYTTDDSYLKDIFNNNISSSDLSDYAQLINNFENFSSDDTLNLTPMDLQNIYGLIAYELINYELNIKLPQGLKSFLILWRNCVLTRLYKRFLDTYSLVKNNTILFNYNTNLNTTLYYSIYPANLFLYDDFINSFNEMFFKNSWIGVLSNNILQDMISNINIINIENISVSNSKIIIPNNFNSNNTNNNFYNLKILNTLTIETEDYYYDMNNNNLYIKYYNYYDNDCKLHLYNNNILLSYNNVIFSYNVNKNFTGMCLIFNLNTSIINFNLTLSINYSTYLPIIAFYDINVANINSIYPQHIINKYILMSKNINNQINILNIINNKIYINNNSNNSIKILKIIYNDNSFKNTLVYVEPFDEMYILKDINNDIINLPTDFLNINEIFINEFILNYEIITNNNFTISTNPITTNNIITLNNNNDYSHDYFYYLVNQYNYKEYYKLIPSKKYILVNTQPLSYSTNKYIYTYSNNNSESEPYNNLSIIINNITYSNNYDIINKLVDFNNLSNSATITLNNFNNINNINYTKINIYRTKLNDMKYYLLESIDISIFTYNYQDTTPDNLLKNTIINYQTIFNLFTYKYKISYYDILTNSESSIFSKLKIELYYCINTNLNIILFNINNISNTSENIYNQIKIYRTTNNSDIYYEIGIYDFSDYYIDGVSDNDLIKNHQYDDSAIFYSNIKLFSTNTNYNIIKVPINELVPNLISYISHSTDINYTNDKQLPDINDYIFNKPFIMLNINSSLENNNNIDNYKNLFNSNLIYFYNINFKICPNSKITLNNIDITFLIPVSSEQFFIDNNPTYYTHINTNTNTYALVNNYNITQFRLNPSFDEFNIYPYFIYNNKVENLIDSMILKFNDIINNNPDYLSTINVINQTNTSFLNIFKTILGTKYGSTTDMVLKSIPYINKINVNNNIILYDLINYSNKDFFNNNHYAFNFQTSNNVSIDPFNFPNIVNLNLLTPIYQSYIANTKLSDNLKEYLNNIPIFFDSNINYINTNIEYLNLSNPINYDNTFISFTEIIENKINTFNNINKTSINLLHPLINNNIIKVNYNNKYYDFIEINNIDNSLVIDNFNEYIIEDQYEDSCIKIIDRKDKFNYIGIISINLNNYSNLDSKYYILDDNKIYNIINNSIIADINYLVVMNPYEITFNDFIHQSVIYINDKYIYIIEINYTETTTLSSFWGNFIINNKIVNGYYNTTSSLKADLYILECDYNLIFDNLQILYQLSQNINDATIQNIPWYNINNIKEYKIKLFNKINYKINSNNIIDFKIISIINTDNTISYFYKDFINIIKTDNFNYYFYYDNSTTTSINLYTNSLFTPIQSLVIKNNIIYSYNSYYNINILEYNIDYYILLINLLNHRYFILQIKDIAEKEIPPDNYYCWVYSNNYLNLITYYNLRLKSQNKNIINISNNNIPTYSFYVIQNNIYYYENNDIILKDNSINYYNIDDQNITQIYLIDNELFNDDYNQLLSLSTQLTNASENLIYNNISFTQPINNITTSMYYKSSFINNINKINEINYNEINLNGIDEIIINITSTISNSTIYHPLIIKQYDNNFVVKNINFNFNQSNYQSSLIPIYNDQNNIFLNSDINNDPNNALYIDNYYYIGSIIITQPLISIDSNMIIIKNTLDPTNNYIYIKKNSITNNFKLWKIVAQTIKTNYIYFWTFYSLDFNIIQNYLILINNFITSEPYYINNQFNYNIKYYQTSIITLVTCDPPVFTQNNNYLIYNYSNKNNNIYHKYYSYNYNSNYNNISIKEINFNSICNFKPKIEFYNNMSIDKNSNIIFYIVIHKTNINIYFNNDTEYNNMILNTNITDSTIYMSIDYPHYIYNTFTLFINKNIFIISNYNQLFLQMNEIIIIDGKFFKVLGLNALMNYYEIELIKDNNNLLRYNYTGYYTIGIYLHNNNKLIPKLEYNSLILYHKKYNLEKGDYYYYDSILSLSLLPQTLSNIFLFNGNSINIKLFYQNSRFYLLDNFIKLKKFDILIDNNNNQIIIQNISDNQIYYKFINQNSFTFIDNTVYNFILPYQPFDLYYININQDGLINNIKLSNSNFIIIENQFNKTDNITINTITNNIINYNISGNIWIKYLNTNYIPYFDNILSIIPYFDNVLSIIPYFDNVLSIIPSLQNNQINDICKYPIELNVIYNSPNQIIIDNNIFNNYIFYYLQPVYLCGVYNNIININNNIITLKNNIFCAQQNIKIIISPNYCNIIKYYSDYKFIYNNSLQPIITNYNTDNVIRYALQNDQLIFLEVINNFTTISEYESTNNITNDTYTNLYFVNYQLINNKLNNYSLLIDNYYLLIDKADINDIIYLIKLEDNNKIKFYSDITITNNTYYISRILPCKINKNFEYTLTSQKIIQVKQRLENNNNDIYLIYKYNIEFINTIETNIIINDITYNYVVQLSILLIDNLININLNRIYINLEDDIGYNFIIDNNNYYITSTTYIPYNFDTIYIKIHNFILNTNNTLTNKLINDNTVLYKSNDFSTIINNGDSLLYNYINNNINELLTYNIFITKTNDMTYTYSLLNNSKDYIIDIYHINLYYIYQPYLKIVNINNNINYNNIIVNSLKTSENIDNDILEYSNSKIISNIWYINKINNNNFYDKKKLFDDVKQLRYKLFININIDMKEFYFSIKPWISWSLINSIQYFKLSNILYKPNILFLSWEQSQINITISTDPSTDYYYLTNDDYNILSCFLSTINSNDIIRTNYLLIKSTIEPLIYNNLTNWLNNPYFFKNVTNNINDLLYANNCNAFFDGNNIIFNTDKLPIYRTNSIELANYITNEYVFDSTNNIVYRSKSQSLLINNNINSWLNRDFNSNDNELKLGISIHLLLRYLRLLGDQLNELYNYIITPFNSVPIYAYNNPYKFIINKLWEKYKNISYLQNINPNFNTVFTMQYNISNNYSYSSIVYLNTLDIIYYGLYSDSYFNNFNYDSSDEYNITYLISNNNNKLIQMNQDILYYTTNPIFPYTINFSSYDINITSTFIYTIFKTLESSICNIPIINPILYQNEITFYSEYKINKNDFIIVNENITYNILNTTILGKLYTLTLTYANSINEIYYNNNEITIYNKTINSLDIIIPINNLPVKNTIIFDLISYIGIDNYYNDNDKYYIIFCNSINFIDKQTFINIDNIIYLLSQEISTLKYYIQSNVDINIINLDNIKITIKININDTSILKDKDKDFILCKYIIDNDFIYDLNSINTKDIIITNSINIFNPESIILHANLSTFYFKYKVDDYNQISTLPSLNKIIYTKQIGQNYVNTITSITKNSEYLYYFNKIIPLTINTYIYIYKISEISNLQNYITTIINTPISHYINQNNNSTYFTYNELFNNINNYSIIQQNKWIISDYNLIDNTLSILLPLDFILLNKNSFNNNSFNYYYLFNNEFIDSTTFVLNNNQLSFTWNNMNLSGNIYFNQICISHDPIIIIPDLNTNYTINFDNEYQYNITDNFYISPYTLINNNKIKYSYLYKIIINNISNDKYIYLYSTNIIYEYIIFTYTPTYIIFATDKILDVNTINCYEINKIIYNNNETISFYQNILQFGTYYNQRSLTSINLFMSNNNNYLINNIYDLNLISYHNYEIINNINITQDINMKNILVNTTNCINTISIPKWINYSKFFNYIRFYFNDQLIEELNENTFNINYYLYSTDETRKQIDNLTKIKLNNNKWEFYIPLLFWFSKNPGLALPLIALTHTEIKIIYKLNDLSYITSNNLVNKNNKYIKINLITDYILLESEERKLFGSYSHEYLINRYNTYQSSCINTSTTIINQRISGLIKDIYLISKPINYPNLTYIPNITNKFDYKYDRYITSLNYYNNFIITNVYTSDIEKYFADDINIIINNINEYTKYLNNNISPRITLLINNFQNFKIWNNDLLKYLMYYEDKYLSTRSPNIKIYLLTQYLLYIYSNKTIINEISPIQSLVITTNGTNLFNQLDSTYFNSVIPTKNFNNSLPTGYYVYTFSLYPLDSQPSGHLNFTNFDSTTITINSNINNTKDYYNIDLLVKEYNIIRIMSGMGSLAWIN